MGNEELKIARIIISVATNGYGVRVEFEEVGDEWKVDKYVFKTLPEVFTFLETNLD